MAMMVHAGQKSSSSVACSVGLGALARDLQHMHFALCMALFMAAHVEPVLPAQPSILCATCS